VLSLSLTQPFVGPLYHWRTSRPHEYTQSSLNAAGDDNLLFKTGPANGAPPQNVQLGADDYLLDHLDHASRCCTSPKALLAVPAVLLAEVTRVPPTGCARACGGRGCQPSPWPVPS
jgi:3-(3-hydroxy-phenyl)propionate hydroxylase